MYVLFLILNCGTIVLLRCKIWWKCKLLSISLRNKWYLPSFLSAEVHIESKKDRSKNYDVNDQSSLLYLSTSWLSLLNSLYYSGAPARAKRAWDRAPWPWNMVNLFSFGCHVIHRAYVRVCRLYGWGRGDYQKEGRGVSGVSWQAHIFNIGH